MEHRGPERENRGKPALPRRVILRAFTCDRETPPRSPGRHAGRPQASARRDREAEQRALTGAQRSSREGDRSHFR